MTVTFSALCAGYLADFASHLQQEVIVSWAPLVRESMSKVDAAPDELRLAGREFGRERDSEHCVVGLCIDRWFPTQRVAGGQSLGLCGKPREDDVCHSRKTFRCTVNWRSSLFVKESTNREQCLVSVDGRQFHRGWQPSGLSRRFCPSLVRLLPRSTKSRGRDHPIVVIVSKLVADPREDRTAPFSCASSWTCIAAKGFCCCEPSSLSASEQHRCFAGWTGKTAQSWTNGAWNASQPH